MKKYIIRTGLLFFAIFLFYDCNKEFLERYPLDEVSSETFWNTENDLMVYNNSIYNAARDDNNVPIMMGHHNGYWSLAYTIWALDEFSDNFAPRAGRHTRFQEVRTGKHPIPSNPQWFGYRGWSFVRACNVGLDNYNNADIDQSTIDKYAGEARLFRGWFYADKVKKFGDAPWVDHELNTDSPELYAPRMSRDSVMENVLADLTFACDKLPEDWGDGNAPGRLNRWCALLVKSRVCLFEGTWQKYHDGSNANMWLQEAADAAKDLIDNGPYSVYNTGDPLFDYNAYHRMDDLAGNPEVMYYRRYQGGVINNVAVSYARLYNGGATKSMVEDYLCTDGLPITLSPLYQGDAQIEDVFINRDPRLRQTVLHPDDQPYYNFVCSELPYPRFPGMTGGTKCETGYHVIKAFQSNAVCGISYNTAITPAITLRFGEALLIYAEAKAELGTITQADIDISINQLRDRVAMPHLDISNVPVDPRYVNDGVSPLIVEIRRERRIELFMEGFRYWDLMRWKQGKKLEISSMGILWDDVAIARYTGAVRKSAVDPVSGKTYIDVYQDTDFANPVFDESKHYL